MIRISGVLLALGLCLSTLCEARDPGLAWPGANQWPRQGDPLFIAKSDLSVVVDRDDLRFAPAAQVRCESEACTYTFLPCQQVWTRRSNEKKGLVYIDVTHLRSAKVVGGEWWMLLLRTEEECRRDLATTDELSVTPWDGVGVIAREGWRVALRRAASG